METFMAKKKRQGPTTESQESKATLIKAQLLLCLTKERRVHTYERLDNKGHEDEQAELLVTSANAGEGG